MENKLYSFIAMYNLIMHNLKQTNNKFKIQIYYVNGNFNIKIAMIPQDEIIFSYNLECSKEEYEFLVNYLGNKFVDEHEITLPTFDSYISPEIVKSYYQYNNALENQLNYEELHTHKIRNTKFEIYMYYLNGLTNTAYDIQRRALEKMNNNNIEKNKRR